MWKWFPSVDSDMYVLEVKGLVRNTATSLAIFLPGSPTHREAQGRAMNFMLLLSYYHCLLGGR